MFSTEDMYSFPIHCLSYLNSYFMLLLSKFELLKEYLNETLKHYNLYSLVATKIHAFEQKINKYDPYTIIIALFLICLAFKICKKILFFVFGSICTF